MKFILPLTSAPRALMGLADKLNELIRARPPLKAGSGITITESEAHTLISTNIKELTETAIAQFMRDTRTFWTAGVGADVEVTPGVINNIAYSGGTITAPSDGYSIYIDATMSSGVVTAVTVSAAASVPAASSTHAYTVLATVAVSGGIATPTPLAWNYSQVQQCGATTYLWGGFGE